MLTNKISASSWMPNRRYHLVIPLLAPVKAPTDLAGVARPLLPNFPDLLLFQIIAKRHQAPNHHQRGQRGRPQNYRMPVPLMLKLFDIRRNQVNPKKCQQTSHKTVPVYLHLHNHLLRNPALQIQEQTQRPLTIHPPAHLHPIQAQKERKRSPGCPVPYLPTTSQDAMKFERISQNCLQMKC